MKTTIAVTAIAVNATAVAVSVHYKTKPLPNGDRKGAARFIRETNLIY